MTRATVLVRGPWPPAMVWKVKGEEAVHHRIGTQLAETTWMGWSASWPAVHLTRVVAALLRSAHPGQLTGTTIQDTLNDLHLAGLRAADVIAEVTADPAVFTLPDPRRPAADQQLILTPQGRRLAAEFRAAQESLAMFRAAQHALLLWCAAHPASQFLHIADLSTEPAGWFYGTQFSQDCLQRAAVTLTTAGYLFTVHAADDPVIQLAPAGLRWTNNITGPNSIISLVPPTPTPHILH